MTTQGEPRQPTTDVFATTALWLAETAPLPTTNSRGQVVRPLLDAKRRLSLKAVLGCTGEEARLARTLVGDRIRLDFAVYCLALRFDEHADPGILSATIQIAATNALEELFGDADDARSQIIATLAPLVAEPDPERTEEEILAAHLARSANASRSRRRLASR